MRYPIENPSPIPGSGNALYLFLLENVAVPGALPHMLWYTGLAKQMEEPAQTTFRGYFPIGETLKIQYANNPEYVDHKFTGQEKNPVFVNDLSKEAMLYLQIPQDASGDDKVFNPNFLPYDQLPDTTKKLNELPTLSLAKSVSSWFMSKANACIYYTEEQVVKFLIRACELPSSEEMMYLLHGNHVTWCTHTFLHYGIQPDIKREFYAQTNQDFFIKDMGTIMPSILYALSMVGVDPMTVVDNLKFDLWGIDEVGRSLQADMVKKAA